MLDEKQGVTLQKCQHLNASILRACPTSRMYKIEVTNPPSQAKGGSDCTVQFLKSARRPCTELARRLEYGSTMRGGLARHRVESLQRASRPDIVVIYHFSDFHSFPFSPDRFFSCRVGFVLR